MESFKKTVLYLILTVLTLCESTKNITKTSSFKPTELSSNHNLFAADLFSVMTAGKSFENVVYSPASIQVCLALTFIGAEGETAEEMRQVLKLGEGDKIKIAEKFGRFLKSISKTSNITNEVPQLKLANRVYANDHLKISEEFKVIARKYFDTETESLNFNDTETVVQGVNQWVAQQTDNKIKNLLNADAVNNDINAIVINALYFKAEWLNAFSQSSTAISKFYINLNATTEAKIMYNEAYYKYVELPELEATALEMPFKNSDISMLIILPNEIEGLQKLELQLRKIDFNDITQKMRLRKVHVHIPKFRIDFDIDLKDPLQKMGLVTAFTPMANFESLVTAPELRKGITEVKHKTFLDVNEAGSEAAAATFVTVTTLSAIFDEPTFRADHPFLFAIRSTSAVYFAGHVVTI